MPEPMSLGAVLDEMFLLGWFTRRSACLTWVPIETATALAVRVPIDRDRVRIVRRQKGLGFKVPSIGGLDFGFTGALPEDLAFRIPDLSRFGGFEYQVPALEEVMYDLEPIDLPTPEALHEDQRAQRLARIRELGYDV